MKLNEIKRNGYYTDGAKVFYKAKDSFIVLIPKFKGNNTFLKAGVEIAYSNELDKEVRPVEAGEVFYNGDVRIVDGKTIDISVINYKGRKEDISGRTTNAEEIQYVESRKIINYDAKNNVSLF